MHPNQPRPYRTTDEYGQIYINDLTGESKIEAKYLGSDNYAQSIFSVTVETSKATAAPAPAAAPTVKVTKKATTLKIAQKDFQKESNQKADRHTEILK